MTAETGRLGRPVEIISFGYGHGPAPEAHATFDVRHHFRDPHVDLALRDLMATDTKVANAVMGTTGIPRLIVAIAAVTRAFRSGPEPGPVTIAVGCAGGRHWPGFSGTTAFRSPSPTATWTAWSPGGPWNRWEAGRDRR